MSIETLREKYGRSLPERLKYFFNSLNEDEKSKYRKHFRLYEFSLGGCLDIDEYTPLLTKVNTISLRNIDRLFVEKFGMHIVENMQEIDVSEDEWNAELQKN